MKKFDVILDRRIVRSHYINDTTVEKLNRIKYNDDDDDREKRTTITVTATAVTTPTTRVNVATIIMLPISPIDEHSAVHALLYVWYIYYDPMMRLIL